MKRRLAVGLLALFWLLSMSGCEEFKSLPVAAKPHVHVFADIAADSSSKVSIDFAFSSLVDRQIEEFFRSEVAPVVRKAGLSSVRIGTARWQGRRYTRLQIAFGSLDELNQFFIAPDILRAILTDVMSLAQEDLGIPLVFEQFDISEDAKSSWGYQVRIAPSPELRETARYVHLEWHIRLPCSGSLQHNATSAKDGMLTWDWSDLQDTEMYCQTECRVLGVVPLPGSRVVPAKARPWLQWAGIGALLALAGAGVVVGARSLMARRTQSGRPTSGGATRPGPTRRVAPPPPPPGRR